jgi:DNA-binding LacI/PurR family transcriptional regulator
VAKDGQRGGKAYLEAIKALRVLIDERYDDGGWLPGGRVMAERVGVSHPTYCKALKFLEAEGVVRSFPSKGHYVVTSDLRCDKIGLVIDTGTESPFIRQDVDLGGALALLTAGGYDAQILQAPTFEQLYTNAQIFGMKGILWFYPPVKAASVIKDFNAQERIPQVVVQHQDYDTDFGEHCVTYDSWQCWQIRAGLLLKRGHREFAYVGTYEDACHNGLVEAVEAVGGRLPLERCVASIEAMPGVISDYIVNDQVTGILSEGNSFTVRCLFEELSELPEAAQPDVIVSYFNRLSKLGRSYPKVKLIPDRPKLSNTLGREAAGMLIGHLTDGKPLTIRKIGLEQGQLQTSRENQANRNAGQRGRKGAKQNPNRVS